MTAVMYPIYLYIWKMFTKNMNIALAPLTAAGACPSRRAHTHPPRLAGAR